MHSLLIIHMLLPISVNRPTITLLTIKYFSRVHKHISFEMTENTTQKPTATTTKGEGPTAIPVLDPFERSTTHLCDYLIMIKNEVETQDPELVKEMLTNAFKDDKYLKFISFHQQSGIKEIFEQLIHDEYGSLYRRASVLLGKKKRPWSLQTTKNFYKIAGLENINWFKFFIFRKLNFELPKSRRVAFTHKTTEQYSNPSIEHMLESYGQILNEAKENESCWICNKMGHWSTTCPAIDSKKPKQKKKNETNLRS